MPKFQIKRSVSAEECVGILKKELNNPKVQHITIDPKGNPMVLTSALKFVLALKSSKVGTKVVVKNRWANPLLVLILIICGLIPGIIYSLMQMSTQKQIINEIKLALM